MTRLPHLACIVILAAANAIAAAEPVVLDARLHHLRREGPREWTEFPEQAESSKLEIRFDVRGPSRLRESTLELRQQDVKQTWNVQLNGKPLGKLVVNEIDMRIYLPVPANALVEGENLLTIEQAGAKPVIDDIRVGEVKWHSRKQADALSEAALEIEVVDQTSGERLPSRLTIIDHRGTLQTVFAPDQSHVAVRPGTVFTANGTARLSLPAAEYTIFAGRGFEYSLASQGISLKLGEVQRVRLALRREVPTEGYVACDTHVHTLTFSGHGDATIQERMITLAAEGIELPIATDHNVQIDYEPFARELGVRGYFTPVVGNEVTTRVGHFNIFPAQAGGPVPDAKLAAWKDIFDNIAATTSAPIAILNHARDLHGGTRPFGPERYNAVVAENLDGWEFRFNAMEVINSGATQTLATQLCHDWMGQLNRGRFLTPVGGSDSHDAGRHFVGQARTYIRCDDRDPGQINVQQAVESFLAGRVCVSYGLLAEIEVNGRRSGETAPATEEYVVRMRVLGPDWAKADTIDLYANGTLLKQWKLAEAPKGETASPEPGVKWQQEYRLPKPRHDVFLSVIATGPGIDGPYWKTAKSYQPTSPDWTPHVLSSSGAVWLDADGDGHRTSAHDYAARAVAAARGDLPALMEKLARYDRAVASQAAHLLQTGGTSLLDEAVQQSWQQSKPQVQAGFRDYLTAWRENQAHRAGTR